VRQEYRCKDKDGTSNVKKTMHARSQRVVDVKNDTNQGEA